MKKLYILLVVVIALSLGACGGGSSLIVKEDPVGQPISEEERAFGAQKEPAVEVIGVEQRNLDAQILAGEALSATRAEELAKHQADMAAQKFQPIIYFTFDQIGLTEESHKIIKHYADYLNETLHENLTLVGHTDARGTPEYNLALGERRAKSVQEAFMLYGVSMSRIDVISMGEESPAVDLQTEEAWAKNRRVEINIF